MAFTYVGEGTGVAPEEKRVVSEVKEEGPKVVAGGIAPQFTAAQSAAGKTAYNSNCAVCHGSSMTNGTFGTPLAGEYFKSKWTGRTVEAFYDKARKTMPPAAPDSLAGDTYADIVAYILDLNGFKAGEVKLGAGGPGLGGMTIR